MIVVWSRRKAHVDPRSPYTIYCPDNVLSSAKGPITAVDHLSGCDKGIPLMSREIQAKKRPKEIVRNNRLSKPVSEGGQRKGDSLLVEGSVHRVGTQRCRHGASEIQSKMPRGAVSGINCGFEIIICWYRRHGVKPDPSFRY